MLITCIISLKSVDNFEIVHKTCSVLVWGVVPPQLVKWFLKQPLLFIFFWGGEPKTYFTEHPSYNVSSNGSTYSNYSWCYCHPTISPIAAWCETQHCMDILHETLCTCKNKFLNTKNFALTAGYVSKWCRGQNFALLDGGGTWYNLWGCDANMRSKISLLVYQWPLSLMKVDSQFPVP